MSTRVLTVAVGMTATVLGLVLLAHPFSTLEVLVWLLAGGLALLGIADLAAPHPAAQRGRVLARVRGVLLIVAAVVVLVAMGSAITTLATVVGLVLIADGALRGWSALVLGLGGLSAVLTPT